MRKMIIAGQLLLGFFLIVHLSSFQSAATDPAALALGAVEQDYHRHLDAFEAAIGHYHATFAAYKSGAKDQSALQSAHLKARLAFKAAEYQLEFQDPQSTKKFLNGPPLPSLEPNVPEVVVIDPKGLQVLDELVFADPAEIDTAEIGYQLKLLTGNAAQIIRYQKQIELEHRHVFEGARQELIRIFTLGLTGFDTPGSVNALPEAGMALWSVEKAVRHYAPLCPSGALAERYNLLMATLAQARSYLKENNDFDSFDRLAYYRHYHRTLATTLRDLQLGLGVETLEEVESLPNPFNSKVAELFDPAFFNTNYYASFNLEERFEERLELGRLLFFDPVLSSNNKRACASCHRPELAFTDGRPRSTALNEEGTIMRNAPTLVNCVFTERFFYDMREPQLERQIKHVVMDSLEFGTDFLTIADKLGKSEEYVRLFREAYPDQEIGKVALSNALAVYVANLVSFNSPFDQYIRGETDDFDSSAYRGFNLFMGKAACGTCHFAPVFNGSIPPKYAESESEVLGVLGHPDSLLLDPDIGRFASGRPIDNAYFYRFSFKTPTIRNIALTAPYMHNGAYETLEQVIDLYNQGGALGMGIPLEHQTLPPTPLDLNEREIEDLAAFMESLTDIEPFAHTPDRLPAFPNELGWNERPIGGSY